VDREDSAGKMFNRIFGQPEWSASWSNSCQQNVKY